MAEFHMKLHHSFCIPSIKCQIGSKNFLKSPFLANFHEISIFESQNMINRSILTWLSSYLSQILKEKLVGSISIKYSKPLLTLDWHSRSGSKSKTSSDKD